MPPKNKTTKNLSKFTCFQEIEQIKDAYLKNLNVQIWNVITSCFQKYPPKELREATMKLIAGIHKSFSNSSIVSSSEIIRATDFTVEQIFLCWQKFMADKSEQFVKDVSSGPASNTNWERAFIDAVRQNVWKYYHVLDQLFQIRKFESNSKKNFAKFHIRKLYYNKKTYNNAITWIQKFESIDLSQMVDKKKKNAAFCYTTEQLVKDTSKMLCDIYSSGILNEFSVCIADFYSKCHTERIKGATMDLICNTDLSLTELEDCDSTLVIYQILLGFDHLLKVKGDAFTAEVLSADVPDNLWITSFKAGLCQKGDGCYQILDLLYHIRQPDNVTRRELIFESVRELLGNEKTFNNGMKIVQFFHFNLQHLKITNSDESDYEKPWLIYADNLFHEFLKHDFDFEKIRPALALFFNKQIEPHQLLTCLEDHNVGNKCVKSCPVELLRPATMELLVKVAFTIGNSAILINEIFKSFYFSICNRYQNVSVPDKLWKNTWKICIENDFLRDLNASSALELLFRINDPEKEERETIIYENIQRMLSKNETFHTAVKWITTFNLKKFKEEHFKLVVIYSCLFKGGRQTVFNSFKCHEDKIFYVKTLDELLHQTKTNTLPAFIGEYQQVLTIEALLRQICQFCENHKIDMEELNLYACKEMHVHTIMIKLKSWDRAYFELYVKEDLKKRDDEYKLLFLRSLIQLKKEKYAYCGAKYFGISDIDLPKELKPYIIAGIDIEKFKQRIADRVHHPVDKDTVEYCKFFGKTYKLITIVTPEALEKFVYEYFIKSKPKIVGIDIESDKFQRMAVLQLATTEWICLIDIQALSDARWDDSNRECENYFKILFDPEITRVGFSFESDFAFMVNRFPFLKKLFQDKNRKVLCLSRLTRNILKDKDIADKLFCNEISEMCSLAKLTKAVLNISLDKSEQCSNWGHGPMTQFQKIYAVNDALIVVLLKNRIEEWLIQICPENVNEIMKNGYIYYRMEN